jgi:hypothetical protein
MGAHRIAVIGGDGIDAVIAAVRGAGLSETCRVDS